MNYSLAELYFPAWADVESKQQVLSICSALGEIPRSLCGVRKQFSIFILIISYS
jgi:hypothetical protein